MGVRGGGVIFLYVDPVFDSKSDPELCTPSLNTIYFTANFLFLSDVVLKSPMVEALDSN